MSPRRARAVLFSSLLLLSLGQPPEAKAGAKDDITRQIRFGAEMARQGNWREAIFRWQRALAVAPDNPRLHNNMAVAYESLGEYDKAEAEYQAALASTNPPDEVRENHEAFLKFYVEHKEREAGPDAIGEAGPAQGARKEVRP